MQFTPEWVSAVASSVAAIGVLCAFGQLHVSRVIAQAQFEDGLSKEYRELASKIPTKALLGHELSDAEFEATFDEFFRYIDLSNEQVSLRRRKRVGPVVWRDWCSGIQSNLSLPSFQRAWLQVQAECQSFQELRRLEAEHYANDPGSWKRVA